ncbi:biorientation of chromosomes in cell division protein 1 [Trichonephila inaurata madagascariensis]|uniref:Biorientation of chromosomes in cell division protein 1 n=1 Tax=Trichonephila inaurata madagascariensis TaxID=2747483 RepID=A0A8X6XHA5_9ARAC|nr:biorientation of chromosomes in cell division protein 1 [Trichonephila inaurata madagascariensis]
MDAKHLVPGDPVLIENIMSYLKAKGIFDEFRHECLADVDTKSSCQNLSQRVDGYTTKFLSGETWNPDLNKNELRNKLRRHIDESGMLAVGADHVVEQVINPKINQLFLPKIIEVVHQYLNEENKKLNKKKESSNENMSSEKPVIESLENISNKSKSTILDPVADILSFSYSKPKQTNPSQNVQAKGTDSIKTERKKEEPSYQVKTSETLLKTEKKKEETASLIKTPDVSSKLKKEESIVQTKFSDVLQNTEKKKDDILPIKLEPVESTIESSTLSKSQNDTKEPSKVKKEIKTEELDVSSDISKKTQKEECKQDKKKDDIKVPNNDANSHSEEPNQVKLSVSSIKSSGVSKHKSEGDKGKKYKSHSSSKISSNPNESRKPKLKEDSSSTKSSSEKDTKTSVKSSKVSSKDISSPLKSKISSKTIKSEKTEDSSFKNKAKDVPSKSSESHLKTPSSKMTTIKKESSSGKIKSSSNKTEKPKISKVSDYKHQFKTQTESDKGHKSSLHSSSYDSSQGSDQDRNSTSSSNLKERQKHFSKHYKKESNDKKSNDKTTKTNIDKKRYQSDSDSNTPKKHKDIKNVLEKQKKTVTVQESAKISSRSNSSGSTSSVSDSPSSSKETSASTSEETSDNSSKFLETKKKYGSKDRKQCKKTEDFPPPPPPPPSSSVLAAGSSSAELSSMDETQSSQESESDSKTSEEESSSESDVENLYSSNTMDSTSLESKLKTPEILNDIYDIFLYSSSSSEFEGYSTPEHSISNENQIGDVEVSSVHTSDLSSFDDVLSNCEDLDPENEENKPIGRLTLKEAEKLLEEKAKQRRLEKSKNALFLKDSLNDKKSSSGSQGSNAFSEDEASPPLEPKRESRRERKLNPKYASSEYASIFNSKKTSFITKQMNQNEDKPRNALNVVSFDAKKSEINTFNQKGTLLKQKPSVVDSDAHSSDELNKYSSTILSIEFPENSMSEFSLSSSEQNLEGSIFTSEVIAHSNTHDNLGENESHGTITLKIKKSILKTDGETNKEHHPHGLKRKCDVVTPTDAKRVCLQNSAISSNSESIANENKPFYNKTNNPSVFNIEKSSKDFFLKQKMNKNGDVLNKMEHVKKKSLSKPNHVTEKQTVD